MDKQKQIEEMERALIDSVEHETLFDVDFYTTSKNLIAKGYRKVEQGECEYCKTGDEKCHTCTEFYKNIDDRCSGYDDGKCIEYTPVKYCFNCGAKMRGE